MVLLRLTAALLFAAAVTQAQEPYRPLRVDAGTVVGDIRFHTEAVLRPKQGVTDEAGHLALFGDRLPARLVIPISLGSSGKDFPADGGWAVFSDANADPRDAASYDFAAIDAVLRSAMAREQDQVGGASQATQVVVRLEMPNREAATETARDGASAPKLVEAARRVAMHWNQGWAQGHEFGITDWLVCINGEWRATSAALQRDDPSLAVGRCMPWPAAGGGWSESAESIPFARGPAFYSIALPTAIDDASEPARLAGEFRKLLDSAGKQRIQLRLGSPAPHGADTAQAVDHTGQAAMLAAALIRLQDVPVGSIGLDPWNAGSGAGDAERQAAVRAAAQMTETPERLAMQGGDASGLAFLAGRPPDRTQVNILVANYGASSKASGAAPRPAAGDVSHSSSAQPNSDSTDTSDGGYQGYDLEVAGLPWGADDFGVYCYRVDEGHNFELVWEGGGRGGRLQLRRQMPTPAVELIVLQRQDRPVTDRLPRRRDRR